MLNRDVLSFIHDFSSEKLSALRQVYQSQNTLSELVNKSESYCDKSFKKILDINILNIELSMMREAIVQLVLSNRDKYDSDYFTNDKSEVTDWAFVCDKYPGYSGCPTITRSNDLACLSEDRYAEEESGAEYVLNEEFGGMIDLIDIHAKQIETDHGIYVETIEAHLAKFQILPKTA